jgi:hypothetical protein
MGLVLCASACGKGGPARRVVIDSDECYAIAYDPDDADPAMFPTALMLRAGPDSGAVHSRAADVALPFWHLFGSGAAWRRMPGDSIRFDFANEMSALTMVVAHDGEELVGTSAFYFVQGQEPYPVMRVEGSRVDCAG